MESVDSKVQEREVARIEGITWAGFAQGSVFQGYLPNGLGSFVYQMDGLRVMAMMSAMEAADLHQTLSLESGDKAIDLKNPATIKD